MPLRCIKCPSEGYPTSVSNPLFTLKNSQTVEPFGLNKDFPGAKELLEWEPVVSIEEGLRKTIEWATKSSLRIKDPFRGWASCEEKSQYRDQR